MTDADLSAAIDHYAQEHAREAAPLIANNRLRWRVARELHDVVFAFGRPIAPFDQLSQKTREFFLARADRVLEMARETEGGE